jgi:type II secretory pathway predicted ATPase ExeA
MIKLGVLAALDQRIAVRYQMTGMTPEETGSYIRHHQQLAGFSELGQTGQNCGILACHARLVAVCAAMSR